MAVGGLLDVTKKSSLDGIFGDDGASANATIYLGYFTTLPGDDGSGGVEPSTGGYARKGITNNSTNFPDASGSGTVSKKLATEQVFDAASASQGTIVGAGFFTASTGGTCLAVIPFDTSKAIGENDEAKFAANSLQIQITNSSS